MSAKLTLREMQELAISHQGKCLSKIYTNAITKLQWQCSEGHSWEAVPISVKSGHWCPDCGGRKKLTIEEMHSIAREKGGKCLTKEYVNARTKLKWQCSKKHCWNAKPDTVKRGSWCPYCIGRGKTIEDMRRLAKAKGGKCLAKKYIACEIHLLWECKAGHRWKCTPSNIQRGKWCPYCYGNIKQTLKDMQDLAKKKGGECLSQEYVNIDTKLKWQCETGHAWDAIPYTIKNLNTWCPHCSNNARLTIEKMQKIVKKNGGRCLSTIYRNNSTSLLWECNEKHQWKARVSAIRNNGSWCPICSAGRSEKECRKILESLCKKAFPKARPIWLRNHKGNQMELDGYCKELNVAFEYQGEQHFRQHRFFHSRMSLKERKLSDTIKRKLCEQHGVMLIEIPYTVKLENMKRYIFLQFRLRQEPT